MIQIKFRAWVTSKVGSDFMMENASVIGGVHAIEENPRTDSGFVRVEKGGESMDYYSEWASYKAYPDSILMQFTGLSDKNGKEIWEGDIVFITDGIITAITYEKGGFIVDHDNWGKNYIGNINYADLEVIGNIYQVSHLLEGEG